MIKKVRKSILATRPTWIVLAIVSIALTVLLGLLLLTLQREQRQQQQEYREGVTWNITQVEREGLMFLHAVHAVRDNPRLETYEEARLLFDIFWSRVFSLDQGEVGAFLLGVEGAQKDLNDIQRAMKQLDPLVAEMAENPQEYSAKVVEELLVCLKVMHGLANRSSEYILRNEESKRERFQQLYMKALLLLGGASIASCVLIFLILRQQKALGLLTGQLEQRVESQSIDLRSSRQKVLLLSQAVEQSPASVIIYSNQGEIEYVNEQFEKISGYCADEVIGHNPSILKSDKTPPAVYSDMWRELHKGRQWRGEICNRRKNGELYWEQVSISPIIDEESRTTRFLAIQEDITQRKHYEERLLHMANFDNLTQLPNRALAMDRLEQAIRRADRNGDIAGLLFLDLDNFKQVNDTLGHAGGDQLLKDAALRLTSCLRSCDTAARFGGDEFIVILSELSDRDDALPIVERIISAFSRPFTILESSIVATTSIGASFSPDDGQDPARLLNNADSAMYLAKGDGKSSYRIYREKGAGDEGLEN